MKLVIRVCGGEYSELNAAVLVLTEELAKQILERMDLVKKLGVFSMSEYSGEEIEFFEEVEFDEEEDQDRFDRGEKVTPTGGIKTTSAEFTSLDLELINFYDDMVCWSAGLKHADPPITVETVPVYRKDFEAFVAQPA